MHHGLANALCLVAGMKFCAARKPGIYRRVGLACGLDLAGATDRKPISRRLVSSTDFLASLGLNTRLRDHGVKP